MSFGTVCVRCRDELLRGQPIVDVGLIYVFEKLFRGTVCPNLCHLSPSRILDLCPRSFMNFGEPLRNKRWRREVETGRGVECRIRKIVNTNKPSGNFQSTKSVLFHRLPNRFESKSGQIYRSQSNHHDTNIDLMNKTYLSSS